MSHKPKAAFEVIPPEEGEIQMISPLPFRPPPHGGLWTEDGTLIFLTQDCGPEGPKG
jgi:hypothetical protein